MTDKKGEFFVLLAALIWSFFPFLASQIMATSSALLVTGLSNLVAAGFLSLLITKNQEWKTLYHPKGWLDVGLTVFFIAIIAYLLLFQATALTSHNNVAILGLSQILWGFVILRTLRMESFTYPAFLGSIVMMGGALMVLHTGKMVFNTGDLLIIAANACFVIGNIFQRRARTHLSSWQLLFLRSLLAGMICTSLSLILDPKALTSISWASWGSILALGIFIFSIEKMCWVEGIHRISISKANIISSIHPGFTMFWGVLLFAQYPTTYQWLGFLLMITGAWFIILKKDIFKILKI